MCSHAWSARVSSAIARGWKAYPCEDPGTHEPPRLAIEGRLDGV